MKLTTTYQTIAAVTVIAPAAGFVLVTGSAVFENEAGRTMAAFRLRDQSSTTATSTVHYAHVESGASGDATGASNSVFAVNAGPQTFLLEARIFNGTAGASAFNGEVTALFVPCGSTGGSTLETPQP